MKFKPILFSTEMVRAILDGRKSQTRRLRGLEQINLMPDTWERVTPDVYNLGYESDGNSYCDFQTKDGGEYMACPKFLGEIGDILWVRESIYQHGRWVMSEDESGERESKWRSDWQISYVATDERPAKCRIKPSIHMPKSACRIFLQMTDIRVERLQDISEEDAVKEGIEIIGGKLEDSPIFKNYFHPGIEKAYGYPKNSFRSLWEKINGADSWDANPFVWVITFTRIDKPDNF